MLHILWMILKILLFVILCILGILLTVAMLVLFVPIRYRIHAKKTDGADETGAGKVNGADGANGDTNGIEATVRISWLLHALSLRAGWRGKSYFVVRVFGIPIYDMNRPKKEKTERAKKNKDRDKDKNKDKNKDRHKEENKDIRKTENIEKDSKKTDISQENEVTENVNGGTENQPRSSFKKIWSRITHFFQKIAAFFRMIAGKLKNIRYTIQKFCDRIKGMAEQASYYKEVLEREETKRAFLQCKRQLLHIWKNIRPKKLSVWLHFGAEDPYTTGQVLALHGMFYPWIYPYVTIEPEFDRRIMEGRFDCKGRVTIFVLILAAAKIYFDKDIRTFIKFFKKEESVDGRQ